MMNATRKAAGCCPMQCEADENMRNSEQLCVPDKCCYSGHARQRIAFLGTIIDDSMNPHCNVDAASLRGAPSHSQATTGC